MTTSYLMISGITKTSPPFLFRKSGLISKVENCYIYSWFIPCRNSEFSSLWLLSLERSIMDSSEQTHPDQYTPQILLDHYYPPPDYDYSTTNPAIMTSEATGNGEAVTAANQSRISLNVHLAVPQGSGAEAAGGQDGSHTPNTPEILNSIVSMTSGPFHQYVPPPPVTAATLMETTELISPTNSTVRNTIRIWVKIFDHRRFSGRLDCTKWLVAGITSLQHELEQSVKRRVHSRIGDECTAVHLPIHQGGSEDKGQAKAGHPYQSNESDDADVNDNNVNKYLDLADEIRGILSSSIDSRRWWRGRNQAAQNQTGSTGGPQRWGQGQTSTEARKEQSSCYQMSKQEEGQNGQPRQGK